MRCLFEEVLTRLRGDDLRDVYAAFDAVPYRTKPKKLMTVLSEETVQIDAPFPGEDAGIYPFEAVFRVSVLIPMEMPLEQAEEFFRETVIPRMEALGSVSCDMKPAAVDKTLERVVLEGTFRMKGIYLDGEEDGV